MRAQRNTLSILLVFTLITACTLQPPSFEPLPYLSATAAASAGTETTLQLEDGARILIPVASLAGDATITLERSPEKLLLCPLPEGLQQLSDFYNFMITPGALVGPVELTLPYDASLIPVDQGELVMAFPAGDSWVLYPVTADGNTAMLYTSNVGDPLIAWNFRDIKGETNYSRLSCAPNIPMQVIQVGEKIIVYGRLEVPPTYPYGSVDDLIEGVPVNLVVNLESDSGFSYQVISGEDGLFQVEIDRAHVRDGWNWVFADADCKPDQSEWNARFAPSEGYVEFKLSLPPAAGSTPASEATPTNSLPSSTALPMSAATSMPTLIPAGAVQLPDFKAQSLDEAAAWLTANGFKYLWIDGSSSLELGLVYDQAPAAGSYHVPRRTSVVLYRTVVTIEDPCAGTGLTPEECANQGTHLYNITMEGHVVNGADVKHCGGLDETMRRFHIVFSEGSVNLGGIWWGGGSYHWIDVNTYFMDETEYRQDEDWDLTLTFTLDGLIIDLISQYRGMTNSSSCILKYTYTFADP